MAIFTYKAAKPSGATLNGQIEGDDERAVRSTLERSGCIVLDLQNREKPRLCLDRQISIRRQTAVA